MTKQTLGQTLTGTSRRQPVGIILSFLWIDYLYVKNNPIIHCKIKETLLIRDLKPALNENVGSEKRFLY